MKEFVNFIVPAKIYNLRNEFLRNGYDIRLVGGCVRDYFINHSFNDIDFCTNAKVDEQIKIYTDFGLIDADINPDMVGDKFKRTGLTHGTISVILDNVPYEITTLRKDVECDGRHAKVEFICDWTEDLARRDLTINAMSCTLDGDLIDPFDGLSDLKNNVIRFVGDPDKRIKEDYLRILRFVRFHSKYSDKTWSTDIIDVIKNNVEGLNIISVERIWREMKKILTSKNFQQSLFFMNLTGISKIIGLPEFNLDSLNDFKVHSIGNDTFIYKNISDPIIVLAYILTSMEDIKNINDKWKLSKAEYNRLCWFFKNKEKNCTLIEVEDILVDGYPKKWVVTLASIKNPRIVDYINSFDVTKYHFPIVGYDIIKKGYEAKEIGEKNRFLYDAWKASRFTLTKKQLLKRI